MPVARRDRVSGSGRGGPAGPVERDGPGKRRADRLARTGPASGGPIGVSISEGSGSFSQIPGIVEELVLRLLARPQQEIDAGRIDGLRRRRARRSGHGQGENTRQGGSCAA